MALGSKAYRPGSPRNTSLTQLPSWLVAQTVSSRPRLFSATIPRTRLRAHFDKAHGLSAHLYHLVCVDTPLLPSYTPSRRPSVSLGGASNGNCEGACTVSRRIRKVNAMR